MPTRLGLRKWCTPFVGERRCYTKLSSTDMQQQNVEYAYGVHKGAFTHVKIRCRYFKPSGKYYSEGCEWFERALFHGCVFPVEYGRRLLSLAILPGLQSGTWDGPFTVSVCGKYEELVLS